MSQALDDERQLFFVHSAWRLLAAAGN